MTNAQDDFHADLISLLPKLRAYAFTLTKTRDGANDLVQEAASHALSRRHQFQVGTNLSAWLHRITRNAFIDELRRRRPTEELDPDSPMHWTPPSQEDALTKGEFLRAFGQLSMMHREVLILATIQGRTYDEIAAICGCKIGTIKSRVCRARDILMRHMLANENGPSGQRPKRVRKSRLSSEASASV